MLIDRIGLFVTVAKHQNLGRTAREMHVSASSVCQRLKSLERDFGVKLYNRTKHGIGLTVDGQTLLTAASEIVNQLETVKKTLHHDSAIPTGSLTLAGTYCPSARYLPSAIAVFKKTHPCVNVTLLTSDRRHVEKALRRSEIEVALIQSPTVSSDLEKEHFATNTLVFVAGLNDPLTKKKNLRLEDLAATSLVTMEGQGTTHQMLTKLERQGLKLNVALRCDSPDSVKAAVQNNVGVGILPNNIVADDVKRKNLKLLTFSDLETFAVETYIVYCKSKPLSDAASDFLNLLRETLARPAA